MSEEYEEKTIAKLELSREVPYFIVYVSPYSEDEIATGNAKYFYMLLVIRKQVLDYS